MASLVTTQGIIHYETYGRGRPIILLHGWLGSWQLWRHTIEELGKEFKMYAIDFYGFGESDKDSTRFTVDNYVEMVNEFMTNLGIRKAPVIGHSMGGTVALSTAIKYPQKVVKAVCVGSPIRGNSLNTFLKLSGNPVIASLLFQFAPLRQLIVSAIAYVLSSPKYPRKVGNMIMDDFSQVTLHSFFESIGSLRNTDLRAQLPALTVPTMGMYGRWDMIVNPNQAKALKQASPDAKIDWYLDAGHFIMIDAPERFVASIREFLLSSQVDPSVTIPSKPTTATRSAIRINELNVE